MKFEIEIPDEILTPITQTCQGFKIPIQRGLEIIICDWIARLNAEFSLFGDSATPGYQCFDHQFNEHTPLGYEVESSYEASRTNWQNEFQDHFDFFQQRAKDLLKKDLEAIKDNPKLQPGGMNADKTHDAM